MFKFLCLFILVLMMHTKSMASDEDFGSINGYVKTLDGQPAAFITVKVVPGKRS